MSCTCACCCGACCDSEGNCTVTLESECLGPVLEFQGKGTTCDPNPCKGACCGSDGSCTEVTEEECDDSGGTFQGAGTSCDPNPCECVINDDCCVAGYFFQKSGVSYGPYATSAECASAAAIECPLFPGPPCPCFCASIDPYCCDGQCQDTPCEPP